MDEVLPTSVLVALLSCAVCSDVLTRRIPNVLVLAGVFLALTFAGFDGWVHLALCAAGFLTGLVIFLPAYAFAGMGAGDVKLMGAIGAFLGPADVILAALSSIAAGGLLGLLVVIWKGDLRSLLGRYALMVRCLFTTGRVAYVPPAKGEAANTQMPYALAIASGTGVVLWYSATPH